jgi:peptide/nickel transport system substrate-binding protein
MGCGRGDGKGDGGSADDSRRGGTAVIALPAEPDVLNSLIRSSAFSGRVLALIQDGLVEMGEDLRWEPRIASSWELAPDSLAITYHLRPWRWEDGVRLDADDVVSTFKLFRDPRVASPRRGFFRHIVRAVAPDSATVRYEFDQPLADPVGRTVHAILPRHRTADLDPEQVRSWELNSRPLASGPFRLVRWDRGAELVLEPNSRYPGEPPLLDRVVFRVMPDETARLVALETGEVDLVEEIPPQAATRLAANENVEVHRIRGRVFGYLSFNFARPVFSDVRVRRAISLAIDRSRLVDGLLYGFASPAFSPLPPALWNHHPGLRADPYAPARAESLLAAAGWRDADGDGVRERAGKRLAFELITRKGDPVRENTAVVIRENLRAVGIDVTLRILEHATGLDLVRNGRFDTYLGHFEQNVYGDPSSLVLSDARGRFNYGGYANGRVDSLVAVALKATDPKVALPVWYRLQEVLAADPPAVYLYYPEVLVGVSTRLRNVRPHLLSPYNNLPEWWIASGDRKYRSSAAE